MTRRLNRQTTTRLLRTATHAGALLPLAMLLWDWWFYRFGPDPIREITLRTGKTTLILLLLSLAGTPLHTLLGWKQLLRLRKPLGLYAFLYVSLHFLTFIWLDYGLDLALIREAIFEKRYALVGFAAFLLLIPLAATSTRWAQRKLGKNWKRLHRLVYVVGVLAIIHFFWLVKNVYTRPILYGTVMAILLVVRVKPIKQTLLRWRRGLKRREAGCPAAVGSFMQRSQSNDHLAG